MINSECEAEAADEEKSPEKDEQSKEENAESPNYQKATEASNAKALPKVHTPHKSNNPAPLSKSKRKGRKHQRKLYGGNPIDSSAHDVAFVSNFTLICSLFSVEHLRVCFQKDSKLFLANSTTIATASTTPTLRRRTPKLRLR